MKIGRSLSLLAICSLLVVSCAGAWGAQTIKGTLLSSTKAGYINARAEGTAGFLKIQSEGKPLAITPKAGASVMRGQIGKELHDAKISDLAPGDWIVAVVDKDNCATSVKAYFGVIRGTFAKLQANNIILADGRSVPLGPQAQIILASGKLGKAASIQPGSAVVCRINPITNKAWTVAATKAGKTLAHAPHASAVAKAPKAGASLKAPQADASLKAPQAGVSAKAVTPASYPKIKAFKCAANDPLKPGDIISVTITGTPNGTARVKIKGYGLLDLDELSPGCYVGTTEVAPGKIVHDAPVIAYLAVDGRHAPAVQAARLLTIVEKATPPAPAHALSFAEPTPTTPAPVQKPADPPAPPVIAAPAPPPAPARVILASPRNGEILTRRLKIIGSAEPDSKVLVTITYSNGLSGLLELSGQIASQLVAVGKNGTFTMGPIALEGPLATKGLIFTVQAYCPDHIDRGKAEVRAFGERD